MDKKIIYYRLIVAASFSFINITVALYAKKIGGEDGHKLTVMLVCVLFGLALSQLYWERAGQKSIANNKNLSAVSILLTILAYILMLYTNGINGKISEIILIIALTYSYSSFNLCVRKLIYDQKISIAVNASIILSCLSFLILIVFPVVYEINWKISMSIMAIAMFMIKFNIPNRYLHGLTDGREGGDFKITSIATVAFIVTFDFIKNQSWAILFDEYNYSQSVAEIMLLRQFIGPISIVLSSYRSQYFDDILIKGGGCNFRKYAVRAYGFPFGLIFLLNSFVILNLGFSGYREYMIVMSSWIAVIVAQDIKSFFARVVVATGWYVYLGAVASVVPFLILIYLMEYKILPVGVSHVLWTLVFSELVNSFFIYKGRNRELV